MSEALDKSLEKITLELLGESYTKCVEENHSLRAKIKELETVVDFWKTLSDYWEIHSGAVEQALKENEEKVSKLSKYSDKLSQRNDELERKLVEYMTISEKGEQNV